MKNKTDTEGVIFSNVFAMKIKRFLSTTPPSALTVSAILLIARVIFGLMFINHGIDKWASFSKLAPAFPDPLGVGGTISLSLIIFAEVICSIAFVLGLLFRAFILPMIFGMATVVFAIHAGGPFATKELSLMYLTIFVLMLISGPGYFSLDTVIYRRINRHNSNV